MYEDARSSYIPEKGFFSVDREADGAFYGSLSLFYGDRRVSEAIDHEFWSRAEQFCGGGVEKLTDTICIIHFKAGAPDQDADPGRCKMETFRCKAHS